MAARSKKAEAVNEAAAATDNESGIYLDPKLAELRDEEAKKLEAVVVEPRPEPTIDPELVKLRDAEIKRGDKPLV